MESSIFVLDPIKGVFWPFKVERRSYLTDTVVRKINSIMKFCNLVLIVKEDPHGRLKTLCNGTNRKPHENQNTSVLIIFFVIIVFLYFHMSFKFSLSSPSHYLHHHQTSTSSKTPKPSCWIYF